MDEDNKQEFGPGAKLGQFSQQIAQMFADRLASHAAQSETALTTRDIHALIAGFSYERDRDLRDLCDTTWASFQQDHENAFYAQMRKYPLERFIVARFAHLLPARGEDPVPDRTLSRRVIPAFIQAIHQMVGPELFDEYEKRARGLVDAIQAKEGSIDWEHLPERPVARVLVDDILIYITRYFNDVAKRRAWMVGFFDRTMPVGKSDIEKTWRFGDMEFHKLMAALYRDLANALFDEAGRGRLEKRYDAASLSQLEQVMAGLSQDQRRVMGDYYDNA